MIVTWNNNADSFQINSPAINWNVVLSLKIRRSLSITIPIRVSAGDKIKGMARLLYGTEARIAAQTVRLTIKRLYD